MSKIDLAIGLIGPLMGTFLLGCFGQDRDAPRDMKSSPAAESRALASSLQPFVDSHTLSGAVMLVASKDEVLSMEAVGWADIAAGKAMHVDNFFWIASMSKPMTGTALMMLVDEGKVQVDDPVEKYLPEFKDLWAAAEQDKDHVLLKRPAHPITVKNVLTHTSGLVFRSPIEQPTLDMLPLRVAVGSYAMMPLQFEPGSKYQYCNAGINTVGRIIEVVSGMPYEEFMEKRLFALLGMKDTTFRPSAAQIERLAKSYKPNPAKTDLEETTIAQLTYPLTDPSRRGFPAGGLFSTASDLARFCRMILGGGEFEGKRLVSGESVRQMTSVQTGDILINGNNAEGYGFGWVVKKRSPGTADALSVGSFGHGGAYKTLMWLDPQKQLIMVLLMQHAGFPNADGDKIAPAFLKAAMKTFGSHG